MITIITKQHRKGARYAATRDQIEFILELLPRNQEWPFRSIRKAQKSLSYQDAARIIEALKRKDSVQFI